MGINRVSKRGKVHIEVRRRWPDGNEFRRFMPNMTVAKQVKARIEVAIADGAWRKLKDELTETTVQAEEATIRAFFRSVHGAAL